MNERLGAKDAERALGDHAYEKGLAIHAAYGTELKWDSILSVLENRECVRYPCKIKFDSSQLQPGEFAYPHPLGSVPRMASSSMFTNISKPVKMTYRPWFSISLSPLTTANSPQMRMLNALELLLWAWK